MTAPSPWSVVQETLRLLEIDEMGFDQMDRMILLTIIDKFGGARSGWTP